MQCGNTYRTYRHINVFKNRLNLTTGGLNIDIFTIYIRHTGEANRQHYNTTGLLFTLNTNPGVKGQKQNR